MSEPVGNAKELEERQRQAEQIVERVYSALYAFLRRKLPAEAVDDVLQEVLLAIVTNLHKLKSTEPVSVLSWCFRIARNKVADYFRVHKRVDVVPIDDFDQALDASLKDAPPTPSEEVEMRDWLRRLKEIDEPCHDLLSRRFVWGESLQEIALELGISYDAARMRLNRCVEQAATL